MLWTVVQELDMAGPCGSKMHHHDKMAVPPSKDFAWQI